MQLDIFGIVATSILEPPAAPRTSITNSPTNYSQTRPYEFKINFGVPKRFLTNSKANCSEAHPYEFKINFEFVQGGSARPLPYELKMEFEFVRRGPELVC